MGELLWPIVEERDRCVVGCANPLAESFRLSESVRGGANPPRRRQKRLVCMHLLLSTGDKLTNLTTFSPRFNLGKKRKLNTTLTFLISFFFSAKRPTPGPTPIRKLTTKYLFFTFNCSCSLAPSLMIHSKDPF